jgi:short-subunit dehydrogenase
MIGAFNRYFLRCSSDLYTKYAQKDSWAVVTGGSDGIGLEICRQLAVQGFNIQIIGRNENKIKKALAEIKKLNP